MRVRDPDGVEWNVTRRWLHVPRWGRRRPDFDDPGIHFIPFEDASIAAVAVVVLVVLFLVIGLPLLLFPLALLVAVCGLVLRIVLRRPWVVEARSDRGEIAWRVRGAIGSRRAMLEIANAFARGDRDYSPPGAKRILPEPIVRSSA
jgi:hypothetical protein